MSITYQPLEQNCIATTKLYGSWALCCRWFVFGKPTPRMNSWKSLSILTCFFICSIFYTACSGVGDVETAFKLFQELQESGQTADRQVYGALISTLGQAMKVGNTERRAQLVLLERACHLLEDMKESNILPDTANWNTLLTCAARSGQLQHAFEVCFDDCAHRLLQR